MAVREIAIFGLGRFGMSLAEMFSERGGHVIAIDNDQKKVDEIADKVAYAIKADAINVETIREMGVSNVDAAIVAMSGSFEASIMAVIACKEMGIPTVIAKPMDKLQADILLKVGADRIIFPEVEMGKRLAMSLMYGSFIDVVSLSDEIDIVEVKVPQKWIGKTLIELNLRARYGFNVIAVKSDGKISIDFKADEPLRGNWELMILGEEKILKRVFKKEK